jgi:8-oxo-dGTP diphosphatase
VDYIFFHKGQTIFGARVVDISELFRITTKAVICLDGKVVLLRKTSGKWDLPGGRLGDGEEIEFGLTREAGEELGLKIIVGPLIQCSLRRVEGTGSNVVVVAYLCTLNGAFADIVLSPEHTDVRLFSRHEIDSLDMRDSYRKSVHMVFSKPLNGLDAQHTPIDPALSRGDRSFIHRLKACWVSSRKK